MQMRCLRRMDSQVLSCAADSDHVAGKRKQQQEQKRTEARPASGGTTASQAPRSFERSLADLRATGIKQSEQHILGWDSTGEGIRIVLHG